MLHIIGHRNPDTDAILSAIVAQEYFLSMGMEARAYRLWELNKETEYVLKTLGISAPELITTLPDDSNIVLVDHNSLEQSIDGWDTLNLQGIIDHHSVSQLSTSQPIQIRFEPLCSTCSILFNMFAEQDLEMSDEVAQMILAGILSDSLAFRSATTTKEDKDIAQFLAEDLWIDDLQAYAKAMFDAKSNLGDMPIRQLVTLDYKEFTGGDKKFGYWVMETTNPGYALERKEEIMADLSTLKAEAELDAIFFSIIDIFAAKNTTLVVSKIEQDALEWAFWVTPSNDIVDLEARMSRKKELEPAIRAYFEKL